MIFDFTVSVSNLITIFIAFVALIAQWYTLKNNVSKATDKVEAAEIKAAQAMESAVGLNNRLSALELQLVKEYASFSHIQAIETRLTSQMQQMATELNELNRFLRSRA